MQRYRTESPNDPPAAAGTASRHLTILSRDVHNESLTSEPSRISTIETPAPGASRGSNSLVVTPVPTGSNATAGVPSVDGKFLQVGGHRFLVKGVAYGTFAPDADGAQFPE